MCLFSSQEVGELGGDFVRTDGAGAFGQRGGGEERGAGGDPAQRRAQLPRPRGEFRGTSRRVLVVVRLTQDDADSGTFLVTFINLFLFFCRSDSAWDAERRREEERRR